MSERLLQRLSKGGRTGVFLGALGVILLALFAPGWIGAILIVVIIAALAVLMGRTWAVQPLATRAVRVIVLLVLAIFAGYKATH